MSLTELGASMKVGKLCFGLKQVLKGAKSKKKKQGKVFVAKDARQEIIEVLQKEGINFEFSKTKEEISKELDLDFESEVYLIE